MLPKWDCVYHAWMETLFEQYVGFFYNFILYVEELWHVLKKQKNHGGFCWLLVPVEVIFHQFQDKLWFFSWMCVELSCSLSSLLLIHCLSPCHTHKQNVCLSRLCWVCHKSLYCCHAMTLKGQTQSKCKGDQCVQKPHLHSSGTKKRHFTVGKMLKALITVALCGPLTQCHSPIHSQFKALKSQKTSISYKRKHVLTWRKTSNALRAFTVVHQQNNTQQRDLQEIMIIHLIHLHSTITKS